MKQKLNWWMVSLAMLGILSMALALFMVEPAHALPEYSERTGQSCGSCHVNPGGGGPRTLTGALWAANGKPDQIPVLSNVLLAPGVTDGAELYDIACATCHGPQGEGLIGKELASSGLGNTEMIRLIILKGFIRNNMPSFEGKFTNSQLQELVNFVVRMENGVAEISPEDYPLGRPVLNCSEYSLTESCGGN